MSVFQLKEDPSMKLLDSLTKAHGEKYIMMNDFEEIVKGHRWTLVVTDKSLYKFMPGSALNQPYQRRELMDVHSIEAHPTDPLSFLVFVYKSKAKLGFSKMRGAMGFGMNFNAFLQYRQYTTSTVLERNQWVFVISRLIRDLWQRSAEALFIPRPEVYQRHDFVIKRNRRGKAQDRVLLLSTRWLYNLEVRHNPAVFNQASKKWALPLACLSSITNTRESELILHFEKTEEHKLIDDEHLGVKGAAVNETHHFLFRSHGERDRAVADIVRLYTMIPGIKRVLQVRNSRDDEMQLTTTTTTLSNSGVVPSDGSAPLSL